MSVYVVNAYDIHDFETFKKYPPQVSLLLKKYGARTLAMQTNAESLEGVPKTMNAIIEFASADDVHRFYNDVEYQKIIGIRHQSTSNCTMIILNQFSQSQAG
jgi:uncharacterized protein (DUF1330 family)